LVYSKTLSLKVLGHMTRAILASLFCPRLYSHDGDVIALKRR
jgi:hypothetical protein